MSSLLILFLSLLVLFASVSVSPVSSAISVDVAVSIDEDIATAAAAAASPGRMDSASEVELNSAGPAPLPTRKSRTGAAPNFLRRSIAKSGRSRRSSRLLPLLTPGGLPSELVPHHYDLTVAWSTPDMTRSIAMDFSLLKPRSSIILNAVSLTIEPQSIRIIDSKTKQVLIQGGQLQLNEDRQEVTIALSRDLSPGDYRISMQFQGPIRDEDTLTGFYQLKDANGILSAATYFEPGYARYAFPCYDEPLAKARFTITVRTSQLDYSVLSNMPQDGEATVEKGVKTVRFKPTPPSPPSLVAWFVGKFDFVSGEALGVPIRIAVAQGKGPSAQAALEAAKQSVEFFTHRYGIPYPYPKLDIIGVSRLSGGGMENIGLIHIIEQYVLYNPQSDPIGVKDANLHYFCHEIGHHWFGNYVTMKWWADLWLKEGFTRWAEHDCIDLVNHKYDSWTYFSYAYRSPALEDDSLSTTSPIEAEVKSAAAADNAFNSIAYDKGGSIAEMARQWIGTKSFISGLSRYLKRFAHSNAASDDLYQTIESVSGDSAISNMFHSWVKNPGFPLIRVKQDNQANGRILVSQSRFLKDANQLDAKALNAANAALWHIPITIRSSNRSPAQKFMLRTREITKSSPIDLSSASSASSPAWLILSSGYYRTLYSAQLLTQLSRAIQSGDSRLTSLDRLTLETDAFALNRASLLPINQLLDLIQSYSKETNLWVLTDLLQNILTLAPLLPENVDEIDRSPLSRWVCQLVRPLYQRIGLRDAPNTPPHPHAPLRDSLVQILIRFRDPVAFADALKIFNSEDTMQMKQYSAIYKLASAADPAVGRKLMAMREKLKLIIEKDETASQRDSAIVSALMKSSDSEIVDRSLRMTEEEKFNSALRLSVLLDATSTTLGMSRLLAYWDADWERAQKLSPRQLPRFAYRMSFASTEGHLQTIRHILRDATADQLISRVPAQVQLKLDWVKQTRPALDAWLRAQA